MATPVVAPKPKPLWRRFASFGGKAVIFGASAGVSMVALGIVYSWYTSIPTPLRVWPQSELSEGLTLTLKTVSQSGEVRFQFEASPVAEVKDAFQLLAPSWDRSNLFTIVLSDKEGFELCKKPIEVIGTFGPEGLSGFSANDSFYCDDYKRAGTWTVLYSSSMRGLRTKSEELKATRAISEKNSDTSDRLSEPVRRKPVVDKADDDQGFTPVKLTFQEVLAGFDFSSREIETASGKHAIVSLPGRATAYSWSNSSRLKFDCDPNLPSEPTSCVVQNLSNGEIVRATLKRK